MIEPKEMSAHESGSALVGLDEPRRSEASTALRRIRRSIDLYMVLTSLFSVLFATGFVSEIGPQWLHGGLSVCGFFATGLMFVARRRLVRRSHDATRWARWALFCAFPVGTIAGSYGLALFLLGLLSSLENSVSWVRIAATIVGFGGVMGYSLNLLVLYRLLRTDFGELLWESESQKRELSDSLNYLE